MVHICDRCNKPFKKLWMLTRHLERKNPCRPIPTNNPLPTPIQIPNPQIDLETGLSTTPNDLDTNIKVSDVTQEDVILLGDLSILGKAKGKKFISEEYIEEGFSTRHPIPSRDIIFEEAEVGDPDRPNLCLSSLTKWQAIVPAYAFNTPITDSKEYAEAPYMPHLIALAREQITNVLKAELQQKD